MALSTGFEPVLQPEEKELAGSAVRSIKRATVREALEAYLADSRRDGRPDTARAVEMKFRAVVYEDPVADMDLETVTRDDLLEWRERVLGGRQARSLSRKHTH